MKSLFEILKKFFQCVETQNFKLDSIFQNQNSKLEPRNSILDSQKLQRLRIELWVKTVNLPLSGTTVGV